MTSRTRTLLMRLSLAAMSAGAAISVVRPRHRDALAGAPISYKPAKCLPRTNTLPTAIPTEQWTPEWLSKYSERASRAEAELSRRSADRLIADRVSMSGVRHVEILALVSGPPDLPASLQLADELVVGRVTAQYLARMPAAGSSSVYLVSIVDPEGGRAVVEVAQVASLMCEEHDGVLLGYIPGAPLLEVGGRYALLAQRADGLLRVIDGAAYWLASAGRLTPLSEAFRRDESRRDLMLHTLKARFTDARHAR
ncbi:MAG: hypothetical protein KGK07_09220 [Chloroflexota bacterium]|nr:hypothetical protein [Chloroflexota bacterium]